MSIRSFFFFPQLCVQNGFSLEEIELAYKKCQTGGNKEKEVFKYLKQNWANSVR